MREANVKGAQHDLANPILPCVPLMWPYLCLDRRPNRRQRSLNPMHWQIRPFQSNWQTKMAQLRAHQSTKPSYLYNLRHFSNLHLVFCVEIYYGPSMDHQNRHKWIPMKPFIPDVMSAVREALLGRRVLVWLFVVVYSGLLNPEYNRGWNCCTWCRETCWHSSKLIKNFPNHREWTTPFTQNYTKFRQL